MERDIEQVIAVVRERLPSITVVQWRKLHRGDDDGGWWFRLPGVERDIQLESSDGACPFLVEHDEMQSTAEAWRASSVERAAEAVVQYLESQLARRDRVAEPRASPDERVE